MTQHASTCDTFVFRQPVVFSLLLTMVLRKEKGGMHRKAVIPAFLMQFVDLTERELP